MIEVVLFFFQSSLVPRVLAEGLKEFFAKYVSFMSVRFSRLY